MFNNFSENKDGYNGNNKSNIPSDTNNKMENSNPQSSELIRIMKNEDAKGINLNTHIKNLLDIFIFQNPIQPIKYFEYYSEKLKQYYKNSYPDSDLDFLNNIEKNIYKNIMDIYKGNKIKNKENLLFEDKASNFSYEEDIEYEGENEYENNLKNIFESKETVMQDLSKINHMFNKAGCGLTNEEVSLIGITMDQMSHLGKFKSIRYWGKIFGLKQNYYVLECEWRDEELQLRFKIFNKIRNKSNFDYKNIYNNGEEVELERDLLFTESYEQLEELSTSLLDLNKNINEQLNHESNFSCPFLSMESDISSSETFGFGTNKMSYFVTNKLSEEWIELPLLKPHHIIQSRNIKRYFVGDLESRVESYPVFQGLEKHYLRAHIARITAETQISPCDYFVYNKNNIKSNKWKKLNSLQMKAMSQKWVHEYVINKNYDPPSIYDLLKPSNWVHHTPLISNKGVTNAWTKLSEIKNTESGETISDEQIAEQNIENSSMLDQYDEYPDIFFPLSDNIYASKIPTWKFELTYPFDHKAAYVAVKSNLWPGAFAVTRDKVLDYTYNGWGHKLDVKSYEPLRLPEYQPKYSNNTPEMTEMTDPTPIDELQFEENLRKMKEENKNMKFAINVQSINEEDEEIVLNQYSYN